MKARHYQQQAIDATLAKFAAGEQRVLVVVPTGGGKTIIAAAVAKAVREQVGGRVMGLAHRDELCRQMSDKFGVVTGVMPVTEKGDERSQERGFHGPPPIVVSSFQTQNSGRGGTRRMNKFFPDDFCFLFVDEAHHACAESYRRVIDYYGRNPNCKILGVTATADRADGEQLGQVFQSVAYDYELPDIIRDGYLVPIRQRSVVVAGLDFSRVRTTAGDLNAGDLEAAMMFEEPLHGVCHATIELACGLPSGLLTELKDAGDVAGELARAIGNNKRRKTLVFCVSVAHAERTSEILNRWIAGSSESIDGSMGLDKRRSILRRYADGELQFLCNCMVTTEGFDDPGVEVVVMARPTKSRGLYCQMSGRATRPAASIAHELGILESDEARRAMIEASSKPYCEILDFVGNAGRHKLITTADILGVRYEPEVVEAARSMSEQDSVDMTDALESAKDELERKKRQAEEAKKKRDEERERRKQAEAATRAGLVGTTDYSTADVDPFDRFGITWDSSVPRPSLPLRQIKTLVRAKVPEKVISNLTPEESNYLSREVIRRFKLKLCTYKQAKTLRDCGWSKTELHNMTIAEASANIDAAKANGWRRPGRLA